MFFAVFNYYFKAIFVTMKPLPVSNTENIDGLIFHVLFFYEETKTLNTEKMTKLSWQNLQINNSRIICWKYNVTLQMLNFIFIHFTSIFSPFSKLSMEKWTEKISKLVLCNIIKKVNSSSIRCLLLIQTQNKMLHNPFFW